MSEKFVIKPNQNESITFSIRIDKDIQEKFDDLANKTGYSRNQLINMALRYALNNIEFKEEKAKP
jgi:predicted transcriptional regulator